MRIALFSDIHGNYQALQAILEDINNESFDSVICLGDIVGIGPSSAICLDEIMKSDIKMILGNQELYQVKGHQIDNLGEEIIEHIEWVRSTLSEEQINYLEKAPLSIEFINRGRLFTFSHFLIDDEKKATLQIPLNIQAFNIKEDLNREYSNSIVFADVKTEIDVKNLIVGIFLFFTSLFILIIIQ